jgi:hypothetical protein
MRFVNNATSQRALRGVKSELIAPAKGKLRDGFTDDLGACH